MTPGLVKRPAFALMTLLFAASAHAQSAVTLYGTIDAGFLYTSNQQTTLENGKTNGSANYQVVSGAMIPSRWGMTGSEDIGNGTTVNFTLENAFNVTNGQMLEANALFDHYAWLGISNGRYGSITLGRQSDPSSDYLGTYASSNTWATLFGSHFGDVDNLNEAFNFSNSVKYVSPSYGGLTFGALFSFGGVGGNFSQNKGWSLGVNYVQGPLTVSAGYLELNNPLNASLGGNAGYIGDFSCANANALYCSLQDASKVRIFGAGGSYNFGKTNIAFIYTHTRLSQSQFFVSQLDPSGLDVTFDIAELNGTYALAPDLQFGVAYIFTAAKPSNTASTRIHQVNLGGVFSLSKRTALYASLVGQISGGAGLAIDPQSRQTENLAQIPNIINSDSNKQLAVIVGVRHNF